MVDYRLPDGTWVTSSAFVGTRADFKSQCDSCDWVDVWSPAGKGVQVQPQRCRHCGWVRGKYLGNPYPEVRDA